MTPEEKVEAIAELAHEANRIYCQTLGDRSQQPWKEAAEWQRDSAKDGVRHALKGGGPEASHENWLATKKAEGWTYGPTKDPEKKTHPCFVPYAELPADQRRKDDLFLGVVHSFARALNLNVRDLLP